jgi:hypothetical protein
MDKYDDVDEVRVCAWRHLFVSGNAGSDFELRSLTTGYFSKTKNFESHDMMKSEAYSLQENIYFFL